jgi:hypothetical protein
MPEGGKGRDLFFAAVSDRLAGHKDKKEGVVRVGGGF